MYNLIYEVLVHHFSLVIVFFLYLKLYRNIKNIDRINIYIYNKYYIYK